MDTHKPRRPRSRALSPLACCAAALAALAVGAPGAAGHGKLKLAESRSAAGALAAYEADLLGPEHAAEHASERRAIRAAIRRWRQLSPEQRERLEARDASEQRALELAAGPARVDGAWTTGPFRIPEFGIHSIVLPTGKVLMFGYPPTTQTGPPRENEGRAFLWDPRKGTGAGAFKSVPTPRIDVDGDGDTEPAPVYCAGQTLLPSGAVLAAGGNLVWASTPDDEYDTEAGMDRVFTFNPFTEQWREQPRMEEGRWYPTTVTLADGRAAILAGWTDEPPGGVYSDQLEVFTGSASPGGLGQIARKPSGDRVVPLYPHMFTLPSREVLLAGPSSVDSALLSIDDFTWQELPLAARTRSAGAAVLMPGPPSGSFTVMQQGGYDFNEPAEPDGTEPATRTTEVLDASNPAAGWRSGPSTVLARSNANVVLLPDGSMVTVGGGRGFKSPNSGYAVHEDGRLRQIELFDRATGTWRLGPPQAEDRAYHSTAVLLPDGRVLSAGDDYHPEYEGSFSITDTAEIYSPPYLFKGRRPKVRRAPKSVRWGDAFGIRTRGRGKRAVLMAPAATTHANDMHQRHVELKVTRRFGRRGLNVVAPQTNGIAPPGYYMLFVINGKGVPSKARWIRLLAGAPKRPSLVRRQRGLVWKRDSRRRSRR